MSIIRGTTSGNISNQFINQLNALCGIVDLSHKRVKTNYENIAKRKKDRKDTKDIINASWQSYNTQVETALSNVNTFIKTHYRTDTQFITNTNPNNILNIPFINHTYKKYQLYRDTTKRTNNTYKTWYANMWKSDQQVTNIVDYSSFPTNAAGNYNDYGENYIQVKLDLLDRLTGAYSTYYTVYHQNIDKGIKPIYTFTPPSYTNITNFVTNISISRTLSTNILHCMNMHKKHIEYYKANKNQIYIYLTNTLPIYYANVRATCHIQRNNIIEVLNTMQTDTDAWRQQQESRN